MQQLCLPFYARLSFHEVLPRFLGYYVVPCGLLCHAPSIHPHDQADYIIQSHLITMKFWRYRVFLPCPNEACLLYLLSVLLSSSLSYGQEFLLVFQSILCADLSLLLFSLPLLYPLSLCKNNETVKSAVILKLVRKLPDFFFFFNLLEANSDWSTRLRFAWSRGRSIMQIC